MFASKIHKLCIRSLYYRYSFITTTYLIGFSMERFWMGLSFELPFLIASHFVFDIYRNTLKIVLFYRNVRSRTLFKCSDSVGFSLFFHIFHISCKCLYVFVWEPCFVAIITHSNAIEQWKLMTLTSKKTTLIRWIKRFF